MKYKMMTKLKAAFAALVLASAVAACSGGASSESATSTSGSAEVTNSTTDTTSTTDTDGTETDGTETDGTETDGTETALTKTQNGVELKIILTSEAGVVREFKQVTTVDTSSLTAEQKSLLQESIVQAKAKIEQIDGATYEVNVTEPSLVETVTLPVGEPAQLRKIIELGVLPVDDQTVSQLSAVKTIGNLQTMGWTVEK